MTYQLDQTKKRHWIWPAVISLLGLLVAVEAWSLVSRHLPVQGSYQNPTTANSEPVQPISVTGHYLLNGTVVWARAVEKYAHGDYSQPFSKLDTFQPKKYDAWSTDFECPITNNVVPYEEQVNQLVFNCRPEFLPYASKYFSIFDLANNHTDNQGGEAGLAKTRQYLNKAGVQYFGTFDPGDSQDVCEVIALPIKVVKSDKTEQEAALPVAFCGWHYFYRKPLAGEIAVMDKYARVMPVFAFAEMGVEYQAKADTTQNAIAHQIVDHNPEFLIANNPHWVQNTEAYKGKLIVYSTGNFIFDQVDPETQRSASIDVIASVPYSDNLAKWLEIAPGCLTFHDTCLAQAQKLGLTKIKLQLKFGVVAGQGGAGKITHKADSSTQTAVLERLNWSQTCQKLSYNACQ